MGTYIRIPSSDIETTQHLTKLEVVEVRVDIEGWMGAKRWKRIQGGGCSVCPRDVCRIAGVALSVVALVSDSVLLLLLLLLLLLFVYFFCPRYSVPEGA